MPPPSEATTNLELILHHLLPLLLLSSLSVKAFVGRWHLLRSKLTHLQASLSQLSSSLASSSSPAASQEQNEEEEEEKIENQEEEIENQNPLLRDHLLPNILSTLETIHSLSEQCRDHPPSGKLLMQSNLDIASSSLSLHLRHLDLLLNSGVLCSSSNAAASNNPTAIVLPQPGPSASRDELAFFVRDLFARLQIGGPDFKKKALESLLQLLRDDDDAESAKNSVVVAAEGDVACLIHLLDSHGHPLFVREQAVHAISVLASASDSSRKAVFEEGALGPLLRLLETGSAAVKEKAAAAVEAITSDPENAWAVSAYGGIRALIEACRSGSPAVQAHSSGALRNAAAVEDIRRALEEEGAIPVLVDLLDSSGHGGGGSSSSGNAAHCLWLMASSGEDFRQAIVQEGGLQRLLQLLQEAPNPETIEHALRAIYALSASASTARALSSPPATAGFLPQLAQLIRQGGSAGLQHISASLICNLSLADEHKRALAGCMGALVKMMESPLQKSAAVGTQEMAARALVLLLSVRSNRKEFAREEKNVLKLVQMLDPRRNEGGMCKSYPVSVAAALTAGGGGGSRKRLVAAGACQHLQVLADMDVAGARKVMQRLAGSRLKNIFFTRAWRE